VERLNREIVKVVAMPDVRARLSALGFEPIGSTPKQFAERIRSEIDKWAKVVRAAGIKAQ
jgi:tripartite-type tricarboxylate transporter receptor subunit TctC